MVPQASAAPECFLQIQSLELCILFTLLTTLKHFFAFITSVRVLQEFIPADLILIHLFSVLLFCLLHEALFLANLQYFFPQITSFYLFFFFSKMPSLTSDFMN